jgi:hypothetical protein
MFHMDFIDLFEKFYIIFGYLILRQSMHEFMAAWSVMCSPGPIQSISGALRREQNLWVVGRTNDGGRHVGVVGKQR